MSAAVPHAGGPLETHQAFGSWVGTTDVCLHSIWLTQSRAKGADDALVIPFFWGSRARKAPRPTPRPSVHLAHPAPACCPSGRDLARPDDSARAVVHADLRQKAARKDL